MRGGNPCGKRDRSELQRTRTFVPGRAQRCHLCGIPVGQKKSTIVRCGRFTLPCITTTLLIVEMGLRGRSYVPTRVSELTDGAVLASCSRPSPSLHQPAPSLHQPVNGTHFVRAPVMKSWFAIDSTATGSNHSFR